MQVVRVRDGQGGAVETEAESEWGGGCKENRGCVETQDLCSSSDNHLYTKKGEKIILWFLIKISENNSW